MIYFVESIPAGGKSYYARRKLEELGENAIYFKEEYFNPIDFLGQAMLTKKEYNDLISNIICYSNKKDSTDELINRIKVSTTVLDEFFFVPFMHLCTNDERVSDIILSLNDKVIDNGRVDFDIFCRLLIRRVLCFLDSYDLDRDYIFEGALLHNPLIPIIGYYDITVDDILSIYNRLYNILNQTNYIIEYVDVSDIRVAIKKAAIKRRNSSDFDWEKGFDCWFRKSKKYTNYAGLSGITKFAIELHDYQKKIIDEIPLKTEIIERRVN